MAHEFCPGYPRRFAALVRDHPGAEVYPPADFRVEWGPVFHRGRLDGTARVLVVGQDPAAHEAITRRILVGEAGQRVQGFLAKLGIDRSYVMVNTFLFSVYGQGGGERHKDDAAIAAYRNRWFDRLLGGGTQVQAVVALGRLADAAFAAWQSTPTGKQVNVAYRAVRHPTYPESASAGGNTTKAEAMAEMLTGWNQALRPLRAAVTPDTPRPLRRYGTSLTPADLAPIPEADLPPGLPAWMRDLDAWAARQTAGEAEGPNATPKQKENAKRATIVVRVPRRVRDW